MNNKIRAIGAIVLAVIWLGLTGFAWFAPPKEFSDAERRPLDQFPLLNADTLMNSSSMLNEKYHIIFIPGRQGWINLVGLVTVHVSLYPC